MEYLHVTLDLLLCLPSWRLSRGFIKMEEVPVDNEKEVEREYEAHEARSVCRYVMEYVFERGDQPCPVL